MELYAMNGASALTETKKSNLTRVFVKGGILSPADFLKVMNISRRLGNKSILFGSRQDIIFPFMGVNEFQIDEAFREINFEYELGTDQSVYQNIVSSYVSVNLVETTDWVKEDTYHFVIDSIDFKPRIKINIVDPQQSLVPLFTGELNFIASKQENYWFLYIRDPRKENAVECWPKLVFTRDIGKISKALENVLLSFSPQSIDELFMIVQGQAKINYRAFTDQLKFHENSFPTYEGLNAMLNNRYWLGLYWRNNQYDIDFMSATCRLCQETNIGKINIIPWKAFIIKGIKATDRIRWEKLMGKYGINERHSSLELNWHLPVIDQEALELKRFLIRELDQQDISTHGLTFTVVTHRDIFLFTSIVIQKDREIENRERYNILYAKNFNPNLNTYICYAKAIRKEMIPALLIELSKLYFRQLNPEREHHTEKQVRVSLPETPTSYQCSNCLTIYDKRYGDPNNNVSPGTPFESLPDGYACHVCESPKKYFVPVKEF